jgi:phage terminase large subunit-like protein
MACAKVVGVKKSELGELPVVEVEWMVGIEPNRRYVDDEVPLWKIREFLIWLRESGVNVVKVTFDSFQSVDMIQLLQKKGFQVEKLSVDKTDEAYRNLVTLYLERRIKHVDNVVYRRELFALEWDGKKVDHSPQMTKDIADAVAGAVYMACKEWKQGQFELMSRPEVFEEKMEEWWYERRWNDYKVSGWEDFFRKWGKKGGGWE